MTRVIHGAFERTVLLTLAVLVLGQLAPAAASDRLEYNRDIRPILTDTCFACHGPDSAARQADLRLDERQYAIEMGVVEPGSADDSEIIRRILSEDPDERMPPLESKKKLTELQKQKLIQWVNEGAEYQLHWSFIAPRRPSLPDAGGPEDPRHAGWSQNPIDRFILARLISEGLSPADEADRHTLARRASLDLTGLPPAPELVESFVNDKAPNAYEKLVDALLESEHWGEHRGRFWLDYARYADTHGIHFDNFREMWSYRDWVINAFNANMPFDQFTIENLAGDLLPAATLEQKIGSGFNRCNMTTNEGGIIDEEYLVLYTRDRTETTSQVWMGLTAGCAVCHSHKFDPLSQHEFYEMAAFFNNSTQAARDGNVKDTPPIIHVPKTTDRQRWRELPARIAQADQAMEERKQSARTAFASWLAAATPDLLEQVVPRDGLAVHAPLNEGEGETVRIAVNGEDRHVPLASSASWQTGIAGKALQAQGAASELAEAGAFASTDAFTCAAWIQVPANDGYAAICARMDDQNGYRGWDFWLQRRQVGMHLVHAWPETGLKVVGKQQIPANEWVHAAVSYDGSGKASGVKVYYNGQPQETEVENDTLKGSTLTDVPFKIGSRSTGSPFHGGLQDLRVYRRPLTPSEVESLARRGQFSAVLAKDANDRSDEENDELYGFWLGAFDEEFQSLRRKSSSLKREKVDIEARGTIAHVMSEQDEAATAYVLNRGEYDQRRDQVFPDTPAVLPEFPEDYPRDRLGFAQWLLLPEHPLTARVTVNRFWQEVFGTGLVKTSEDFGVSGELPSHPELLDWLAVEFRESGWDVKRLFKLILMSATYRQSAVTTPEKTERDPENRLLARGSRFRMDAEMIRDYALAVSGLLVPKIGGPSVKPYQPPGVWEAIAMNVSNTRKYERGTGEDLYRRSVYTFIKRMAPPASMEIFNAPNREFCVLRRDRTNTPLQALVTLNDEQFVEAARHLAEISIFEGGDSFLGRLEFLGNRLVSREFRADEQEIIRASHDKLLRFYRDHPQEANKLVSVGESKAEEEIEPPELAAWTMLANQLMNLDEVLNK